MGKGDTSKVILLRDLWNIFIHRLWLFILAAVIGAAALFGYSRFLQQDKYSSTATLYILKQGETAEYTQADFSLALNVVSDCEYMIKSHEVLDGVISKLGLTQNYKELCNSITVSNPTATRVLEVTVESDDAQRAKEIVDEICQAASAKANSVMGMEQVNVYAPGDLNGKPSNDIPIRDYVLVALACALLVYVICLCRFLLDDKIESAEDVERYLGLSVLGEIPNAKAASRKNGKYGGQYAYGSKKGGKSR